MKFGKSLVEHPLVKTPFLNFNYIVYNLGIRFIIFVANNFHLLIHNSILFRSFY